MRSIRDRSKQNAHEKIRPGGCLPFAIESTPTSRLMVGDENETIRSAALRCSIEVVVRAARRFDSTHQPTVDESTRETRCRDDFRETTPISVPKLLSWKVLSVWGGISGVHQTNIVTCVD